MIEQNKQKNLRNTHLVRNKQLVIRYYETDIITITPKVIAIDLSFRTASTTRRINSILECLQWGHIYYDRGKYTYVCNGAKVILNESPWTLKIFGIHDIEEFCLRLRQAFKFSSVKEEKEE